MFKDLIKESPFVTEDASMLFSGVQQYYEIWGDNTLLSACRALLVPRMKNDERLIIIERLTNTCDDFCRYVNRNAYEINFPANERASVLYWGNVYGQEFNIDEDKYFPKEKGWQKNEKNTHFFANTVDVAVYTNESVEGRELSVVFVHTNNIQINHYVQCGILNYVPWLFRRNKNVSPEEMELIQGLREKKPDQFKIALQKLIQKYDLRKLRIERLLAGFETSRDKRMARTLEDDILNCEENMRGAMERYADYARQKRDKQNELAGIYAAIENNEHDGEIMAYFNANKTLWLISANGETGGMSFLVRTYLEYFDQDAAEACIENKRSYMYTGHERMQKLVRPEDMELLLRALFVDCTMKIRICAAYTLRTSMQAYGSYDYGSTGDTYLPNPHIHYFNCLGYDYPRYAAECIARGDIIGAIDQCIASAKSVNFEERPTAGALIEHLYGIREMPSGMSERYIELADGRIVTPKEAIAYLKKQKEEESK